MAKKYSKKFNIKKSLTITFVAVFIIVLLYTVLTILNITLSRKAFSVASKMNEVVTSAERVKTPIRDNDGFYTFTLDRDIKILQLSDIHIGGGFATSKKDILAINAIKKIVSEEKPDLCVITGDMAYPFSLLTLCNNNQRQHQLIIDTMNNLGVYWTVVFGNHDSEFLAKLDREQISNMYMQCAHPENNGYCLYDSAGGIYGYGNSIIKVKNSLGKVTNVISLIDSNDYKNQILSVVGSYDNIRDNQIEWCVENLKRISDENADGKIVKSIMFFHIPIKEYKTALDAYYANDKKLIGDNYKYYYGNAWESKGVVSASRYEDNVFEKLYEYGSTLGIFCGHDHDNNISIGYDPNPSDEKPEIRLTFGGSIDYLAYFTISSRGYQRGGTIIYLNENGFTSEFKNLYTAYGYHDNGDKRMTPPN